MLTYIERMEKSNLFKQMLDQLREKHGTLADAFRAAGVDPNESEARQARRTIERRMSGQNVNLWDLWALRGLLSFRRKNR